MTLDDRLMAAARLGETNKIRELVEQGGNINCQDDSHQTPLLKASEHGHTAAVEEILKLGGNMNVSDNRDSNALHYAAYNGHTDTVEVGLCVSEGRERKRRWRERGKESE